MPKSWLALSAAVIVTGALVTGCKPAPTAETASATTAAAPHSPFSINELMVMIVDVPGEHLWDIEKDGHAPKTDEAWYQLENHAVELGAAATIIQLPGTGPSDAGWVASALWQTHSRALVDSALHARQAAKAKDLPALVVANGEIVEACEGCHKEFKPDIPTGRLFLHPLPDS